MAPVVAACQAMRGVSFLVAVTFVAEIGDVRRFESPRQLMAFLGLVPCERSTGDTVRRGGLTLAGNRRARRALVGGRPQSAFGSANCHRIVAPPQWPAHGLGESPEHDVEADADPLSITAIGIHRVRQPGRKEQQRAVLDVHHDLIRIVNGQFGNRRPHDRGLRSGVVKIDRVRALLHLNVIDAAQKIVRMGVHLVGSPRAIDVCPATGHLELRRSYA